MNLKEAFRFQNKLQSLMDDTLCILEDERNTLKTETTYLRKKAVPEAENETIALPPESAFAEDINAVADFLLVLLDEREKLCRAIRAAKDALPVDMDSQVGLNAQRQRAAAVLRGMSLLRSSETVTPGGGTGYRFNAEGNQIVYRCDVKQVSTINFNRNKIRAMAAGLSASAEAVSTELDRRLVNSQVDYVPPFGVNDGFEEILRDYLER